MEKTVIVLENDVHQQHINKFAETLTKIIARGVKTSKSVDEFGERIEEMLVRSPSEELENSILSLVSDGLTLENEQVSRALKDALWINSREAIHNVVDMLIRYSLPKESRAE